MRLLYEAATRIGTSGQPPEALVGERISPEQAIRALTINAAWASFQEDELGSIAVGKLADLVVLSGDPLAVGPEEIPEIDVLMTMIGGAVEWCAPGSGALLEQCIQLDAGEVKT